MQRVDKQFLSVCTVPRISVICWTYNHERLISRAIDSILEQQIFVPVELIIHDDASTDRTPEIIRDYQSRFPAVVRLVLQATNQLQHGINFVPALFALARGQYIAICDGDDYWTCPDKLTKQLQCLEDNPHACGCFHRADDLAGSEDKLTPGFWGPPREGLEFGLDDLFRHGNFTATASLMLRTKHVLNVPGTVNETPHGDFTFLLAALRYGPLVFLNESMSVYRRHVGGQHSTTYGSIATFRAVKSLVFGAHFLGLDSHPSYLEAFRWRSSELEGYIKRDRIRLETLEAELLQVKTNYERSRRSIFFRAGMLVDRTLRYLRLRGT